jgi:hypothetical protein
MKVTVTHTEVKRRNLLHYVNCSVEFSETEKAIMRERSLTGNSLVFEKGQVNYPPEADHDETRMFKAVAALCAVAVVPFMFISSTAAMCCLVGAIALFIVSRNMGKIQASSYQHEVQVKDLIAGKPFSVVGYDAVQATNIDAEIREVLEGFKRYLTISAETPRPQTFEL